MSNIESNQDNSRLAGTNRISRAALYREWRPRSFSDVVEQAHVVKTLKNSIAHNRLAHAYLFCGTRGTGKTTLAQILSRAVNCLNPKDAEPCNECEICAGILSGRILDVVEIDAASNNSVDNIRNLRDVINYAPAEAKYKVYIIDEVHMLSGGAFNALLKTLEEPPAYVIFILATTEPHKLPATILSRCQRFDFRRISEAAIAERLELIAKNTCAAAEPGALRLIAKLSDGALRDAISIFDQCASSQGGAVLTLDDVLRITGRPADDSLIECARILIKRDIGAIQEHVAGLSASGASFAQYIDGMTTLFRNLLMIRLGQSREAFPEMPDDVFGGAAELAAGCDTDYLLAVASEFSTMAFFIKDSANQAVLIEVALAKICLGRFRSSEAIESINSRIRALELKLDALKLEASKLEALKLETMPIYSGEPPAAAKTEQAEAANAGWTKETGAERTEGTNKQTATPNEQLEALNAEPAETSNAEPAEAPDEPTAKLDEKPAELGAMQAEFGAKQTEEANAGPAEAPGADAAPEAEEGPAPRLFADTAPEAEEGLAPRPFSGAAWSAIVNNFTNAGNPMLYTVLQTATAQIKGDNFYIILPMNMASLCSIISSPDNLSRLRSEIQSATGRAYAVHVISEKEKYRDIARQLTDKFGIPTNIYP